MNLMSRSWPKSYCYSRWAACLLMGLLLITLTACATGPQLVNHAFSFDAMADSPDILILDYRYGQIKPQPYEYREGLGVRQAMNYNGGFIRGDSLYVKWRIKSTGQVHEDTVDLKSRLPADITYDRIHFVVKGPQLYVYLITSEKLHPNPCPRPDERHKLRKSANPSDRVFAMYCSLKILTLYPDRAKQ